MNTHSHISSPGRPGARPSTIHLPPSTFHLQSSLHPSTRGAALLVVIGLISLLLISTMAFSVLMSIERSAASNYRHSVQARQLLYAGLAQAISDIDASVGDDAYPPWTTTNYVIGTHSYKYMQDVRQSMDTTVTTANVCPAKVLSAEAMKYIPKSLYPAMQTVIPEYLSFAVTAAGQSYTVGRYAYVAANVSGLLDANTVATTNR